MENYTEQTGYFKDPEPKQELIVDEMGKALLLETVRWTKFNAIMMAIWVVFMLLASFIFMNSDSISNPAINGASKKLAGYIYLFMSLICIYPTIALFKYSAKTKAAIKNMDQASLTEGFRQMKNRFKYFGILTIALIIFYGIILLFAFAIGFGALLGS